ncbi:hypothetical protein GQ53DRAFT_824993 [Thozetella sp. PMI_491]|nr:hypothetical protein GQ53DRAFT_824993 [Thozetella sp. PMI_491]
MRQIYEPAAEVLVWLGPDYDDAGKMLNDLQSAGTPLFAKRLHRNMEYNTFGNPKWLRLLLEQRLVEDDGLLEESLVSLFQRNISMAALESLATRAWWERVWVIQEFVSNPITSLICGSTKVDADAIGAALVLTRYLTEGLTIVQMHGGPKMCSQINLPQFGLGIDAMFLFRWRLLSKRTAPLYTIIRTILIHRWKATDPRDY